MIVSLLVWFMFTPILIRKYKMTASEKLDKIANSAEKMSKVSWAIDRKLDSLGYNAMIDSHNAIIDRYTKISNIGSWGLLAQMVRKNPWMQSQKKLQASMIGELGRHPSLFSRIKIQNNSFSDQISSMISAQALLSSQMLALSKTVQAAHVSRMDAFDAALKNVSSEYIAAIDTDNADTELTLLEEVTQTISSTTEIVLDGDRVTKEDLEVFRLSLIADFKKLLEKTTSQKARVFILDIMAIVSFLFLFYNPLEKKETTSQKIPTDAITKEDFEVFKKEILQVITEESSKSALAKRVATTDVNLRYAPKKNSQKLGVVSLGQIIVVLHIHHKYLLITYQDQYTGETKSGYVYKKYFKGLK